MNFSWDNNAPEVARVRKRLVICCDGTWQSSVTIKKNIPSNVTRLARSFAREDIDDDGTVWEQIVYYDAGIGSGEISKAEKNRQGGFGHGFTANVIEAYNFLALNWYPGDKIFCFGFSRGAYTARAVAGLVNDIGIISPRDMQDFPELYAAYTAFTEHDSHGFRKSRAYREWQMGRPSKHATDDDTKLKLFDKIPHSFVREESRLVEVVGVFDTVGSLGVPDSPYYTVDAAMAMVNKWWGGDPPGLHNVSLSTYIRNAFHALALDERRKPFSPTLWHLPTEAKDDARDERHQHLTPEQHQNVIQTARLDFEQLYIKRNTFDNDKEYDDALDKAWEKLIDCQMAALAHRLDNSNLKQVWFPGMHINIGGGSDDPLEVRDGDFEQIALISFAWMCEQIRPFIKFEERLRKRSVRDRMALIIPCLAETSEGKTKNFGSYAVTKPFWKALDWTGIKPAEQKVIANETICGWAVGPIPDSYTGSMVATGALNRSPGNYTHINGKKLGPTNEEIHPSIAYRMKMLEKYRPAALNGFQRVCIHGEWFWKKEAENKGDGTIHPAISIPEFEIQDNAKFSRFLARNYVKYTAEAEQLSTLNKRKDKKQKPTDPAPNTPPDSPTETGEDKLATTATDFLNATKKGVDWVAPPVPAPTSH